jgi:hypothetical protein
MVDTGAVRSVIPAHVMEALGLMSRGNPVAEYADGRTEVVAVTEPIIIDVMGRDTLEEALVLGDENYEFAGTRPADQPPFTTASPPVPRL